MSLWGGLPIEILYCIFTNLNEQTDLKHCLFTCKNWHKATQSLVYNSVKLYNTKQIISFANCIKVSRNEEGPSAMVKKICIYNNPSLDYDYLADILKSCPAIKTIDTIDFNPTSRFFATIMQEHNQGNCRLLSSIPFPMIKEEEDVNVYRKIAWNMRERLIRLMITDSDPRYDSLHGYTRLKYLLYNANHNEALYELHSIIKNSTTLESVEINQCKRSLTDNINSNYNINENIKITPCYHIREFIGSGILLPSREMFDYLMFIFPNLTYLNIFFALNTFKSQLLEDNFVVTNIAVKFLLHVYRNIQTFNIEQLYVLNVFDVAVGFLLGASTFNGILEIRYENNYNHPQHVSLTKNKFIVKCVQSLHTPYSILPHRELIRRFGSHLAGVILDFGDAYALYQDDQVQQVNKNDVHGYCIDYIFKHCPKIESLELINFLFSQCDTTTTNDISSICHTLQVLVFDCCEFSNTALEEISRKIPTLFFLSILDSDFEYDSIWEMLLYNTCIHTLHWKDTGHESSQDDYLEFHLCLEIEGDQLFYTGNNSHVTQSLYGDAYHSTLNIGDKLSIKLACKQIQFFHLDIPNIKMLIKYPGQTHQQIFVHPSPQYAVETERIMQRKL